MILFFLLAQPSSGGSANVSLDDERIEDGIPKGLQKVELDLDDSLFLEFDDAEEKKPEPPPAAAAPQEAPVDLPAPLPAPAKKKWPMMLLVAVLCLVLGGGGAFFLLKKSSQTKTESAEPADQPPPEPPATHEAAPGKKPEKTAKPRLVPVPAFYFDQFQVEHVDNGKIRLLSCRISVAGINQDGYRETEDNLVAIRDGIYLYLKDSPLTFLTNTKNIDVFGRDILKIINSHLTQGRYMALRFDEYVVQ